MHDVEGLDGLATGAFDEVVFCGHEDDAVGAGVDLEADVDEVGAGDELGVCGFSFSEEADEGGVGVGGVEGLVDFLWGGAFAEFCGGGGDDAGGDGDEVGEEGDGDGF